MRKFISFIKFYKKSKGSATLEATMIFPLIMFILFGIMYLTIIHYQNNVMIAESIRAMNRAGAYWQYIDMDLKGDPIYDENGINKNATPPPFDSKLAQERPDGIINIDMIKNRNPYRTIMDVMSEGISKLFGIPIGFKKMSAKDYVNSRIANIKFTKFKDKEDSISNLKGTGYMFVGDDLEIEVGRSYINPLLGLSRAFLGNNNIFEKTMKRDIKIKSVISNQVEFIRNIDTVYDIGKNLMDLIGPK